MLNPWHNRGPLLFCQDRMGLGCRPFRAWKFRSMTEADTIDRGAFDALDTHRITPLGGILRRTRLDELPQVINVLRGEMSLIGPRPDFYEHALTYLDTIPGYRERHSVLPGISGHAQTEVGYVDGIEGMHAKVAADLVYVQNASLRFDLRITWRTLAVVAGRHGA
jgi:lipopolysaccharide/colanic/teichoic acid biosynthesis glycosyltransferase